ncbi:hypothetical protein GGF32_007752 [Allomyces javanicus]|nr:hypothetical protein GGF32_007752 [Allomyces javanicus]
MERYYRIVTAPTFLVKLDWAQHLATVEEPVGGYIEVGLLAECAVIGNDKVTAHFKDTTAKVPPKFQFIRSCAQYEKAL